MILKQKKKQETEKSMEENRPKITWRHMVLELLMIILAVAAIYGISWMKQAALDVTLSNMVLGAIGVAVLGFHVRQAYLEQELDYDNNEHYYRFWICFLIGLVVAFVCVFLPIAGWPYMIIFVMLALYSNMSTGILAASVLLMISTLLGGGSTAILLLYFLSGLFAVTLFRHLDDSFKIGTKMFLSLLCLLVCLTAGVVLLANERLTVDLFVIPVVNVIISGILLLVILKLFCSMVIYKHREKYLELNDTENTILAEYRTSSKSDYMHSIHTAYFCERIASKLSLNTEDMKCAGYYHKIAEEHPEMLDEHQFPPRVKGILTEYFDKKKPVKRKETAVLMCADTVMNTIQILIEKSQERGLDYDYIIDNVFHRFSETDAFAQCDITLKEIKTMHSIFKEEKLYYDFLR